MSEKGVGPCAPLVSNCCLQTLYESSVRWESFTLRPRMRVAVVGASGKTGSLVVSSLLSAGHEVVALARSLDRAEAAVSKVWSANSPDDETPLRRVTYAKCDVSKSPPTRGDLAGCVAAVWAAQCSDRRALFAAPGPQGPEAIEQVALGKFAAVCAAVEGLERIVVVSTLSADRRWFWINVLLNTLTGQVVYYKHQGEKAVAQACACGNGVQYVVVRPGGLTDACAQGPSRIRLAPRLNSGRISRADVAGIVAAACVSNVRPGGGGLRGITFDCVSLGEAEPSVEAATWIDAIKAVEPLEEAEPNYMS
jgi:hypothetical protein